MFIKGNQCLNAIGLARAVAGAECAIHQGVSPAQLVTRLPFRDGTAHYVEMR